VAFGSPPEFCRTDAATPDVVPRDGFLPCGLFPFGVFPVPGSHLPWRVPASRYVPSRRFARPQGLSPPGTCQPCFVLVPPLGFALQGRSPPAEPFILSDAVPSRGWQSSRSSVPAISGFQAPGDAWIGLDDLARRRSSARSAPPQGLAPCERPCPRGGGLDHSRDRDPPGLSLLEDISRPSATRPGVHPLVGLAPGAQARPGVALQSVGPTSGRLGSLEPAALHEVGHLVDIPPSSRTGRPGVAPRRPSTVAGPGWLLCGSPAPLPELGGSAVSVTAPSRSG